VHGCDGRPLDFFSRRRELISVFDLMGCLYARLYAPEKNWEANETRWGHPKSGREARKTGVCLARSHLVNGSRNLNSRVNETRYHQIGHEGPTESQQWERRLPLLQKL